MEGYTLYSFELNFCMKFQFPKYDLIVTFNRSVRTTSFQLNYVVQSLRIKVGQKCISYFLLQFMKNLLHSCYIWKAREI